MIDNLGDLSFHYLIIDLSYISGSYFLKRRRIPPRRIMSPARVGRLRSQSMGLNDVNGQETMIIAIRPNNVSNNPDLATFQLIEPQASKARITIMIRTISNKISMRLPILPNPEELILLIISVMA